MGTELYVKLLTKEEALSSDFSCLKDGRRFAPASLRPQCKMRQ
jgi:hypothetical protein